MRFILEFDHDSENRGLTVCLIGEEKNGSHGLNPWRTKASREKQTPPQQ